MWPDGKETKAMVQQTTRETTMIANDVSEVMSSSAITVTLALVTYLGLISQETSGGRTFESGSRLPIHP